VLENDNQEQVHNLHWQYLISCLQLWHKCIIIVNYNNVYYYWLSNGCIETPEEIANIIVSFIEQKGNINF